MIEVAKSLVPVTRTASTLRPLSSWDPFREFDELQERFDRLVASVFGTGNGDLAGMVWAPLADVTETEDAYLIEVELPGVKREDITVEFTGAELRITGEFTEREREGILRRRTRRTGRFEYRTTLPSEVNADAISAELADGVLTVRVPRAESAKPRRIPITSA